MSRRALLHNQVNKQTNESLPSRVSRLLSASGRGGGCWQAVGAEIRAMRSESGRAGICHGPERGRAGTGLHRRVTFRRTSGFRVGGGKEPQSQRVKRKQLQAVPGFGQGARRRSRPSSGRFSWRQTRSGLGSVFSVLFSLPPPPSPSSIPSWFI